MSTLLYFASNPVLLAGLCLLTLVTLLSLLILELWDLIKREERSKSKR